MFTITNAAKEKVLELMKARDADDLPLRLAIKGRTMGTFIYDMRFVEEGDQHADDNTIETNGLKVFIDPDSAPKLEGSTMDYVETPQGGGFSIDNPNPLWDDPLSMAVQEVIDNQINPSIAGHGGIVMLLDVKGDTAYIQFGGGCMGCGMANVTLKESVEAKIKEAVPTIQRVLDQTEHARGANPYYK